MSDKWHGGKLTFMRKMQKKELQMGQIIFANFVVSTKRAILFGLTKMHFTNKNPQEIWL